MTDIPIHPSALEADGEDTVQTTLDFYVQIGLVPAGSQFVPDESMPEEPDEDAVMKLGGRTVCHTACKAAYAVARNACNLIPFGSARRRCRQRAEAAYRVCIAACDLVS